MCCVSHPPITYMSYFFQSKIRWYDSLLRPVRKRTWNLGLGRLGGARWDRVARKKENRKSGGFESHCECHPFFLFFFFFSFFFIFSFLPSFFCLNNLFFLSMLHKTLFANYDSACIIVKFKSIKIIVRSFGSSKNTKLEDGPYCTISGKEHSSVTLYKTGSESQTFCCNFKNLHLCSLNQRLKFQKGGQIIKILLRS